MLVLNYCHYFFKVLKTPVNEPFFDRELVWQQ